MECLTDENSSPANGLGAAPTFDKAPSSPSVRSELSDVSSMGLPTPADVRGKRDAASAGIDAEEDGDDDDTISIASHASVSGKTPKKRPRIIGRLSNIMRSPFMSKTRAYTPKGPQRRNSVRSEGVNQNWHETVAPDVIKAMAPRERNRQQAIHEVVATEELYVNDLSLMAGLMAKVAQEGAKLTDAEMHTLFGGMGALRDMHASLLNGLTASRAESGIYAGIGATFVKAAAQFGAAYTEYLPNIEQAQHIVKTKAEEPLFQLFLEAIRSLPQTNRQEFIHYLDRPRARLARYGLLLSAVLKHTDPSHPDHALIADSIASIDAVVRQADRATGAAKVERLKAMLKFDKPEERERCMEVLAQSTQLEMECGFVLLRLNGRKLNQEVTAYLFNACMLLVAHKRAEKALNVYGEPMRLEHVIVRDEEDDSIRVGRASSVRGRFDDRRESLAPDAAAQVFHVRHAVAGRETVCALRAPSERIKREWLACVTKLQTGRAAFAGGDARLSIGAYGSAGALNPLGARGITRSQTMSVLPDEMAARLGAGTPIAESADEFVPLSNFEFGELKEHTV